MHLSEPPSMPSGAGDSFPGKPAGRPAQGQPRSSYSSDAGPASSPASALCNEKVVASGHNITVSIGLLEPILFLESYERNNPESRKTAMLRGHLRLNLSKPSKIKKVYLQFRGTAVSCWPEGVPPKRTQSHHTHGIMNHTWTFFNAQFPSAELDYGADQVFFAKDSSATNSTTCESKTASRTSSLRRFSVSSDCPTSPLNAVPLDRKRLSLQSLSAHSFDVGEPPSGGHAVSQRGFKWFPTGDYVYNFELPLDSCNPQTFRSDIATIKYELGAMVERSGVFRPNLIGIREIPVIRTPAEGSLEHVEPIAITRTWDDQLRYEVIISGKAFPMGAQVPIAVKLTPLAKVACHRIRVYVTETIQQRVQRKADHYNITKKLLLFEACPNTQIVSAFTGSSLRMNNGAGEVNNEWSSAVANSSDVVCLDKTNLLGNIESGLGAGPTELEFDVQLPTCRMIREGDIAHRLHCDIDYEHLGVSHWIKIVLRLSRPDEVDPNKRRHFEISIDSPFHIISCLARQANVCVPAYTTPSSIPSEGFECGCPDFPTTTRSSPTRSSSASATPPENQLSRPIHLLRAPSYGPPPFDDLQPPPPPGDPPPDYASVVCHGSPQEDSVADYFDRLHRAEREYDDITRGPGRVDIPLTPGGRVHRSMDLCRDREPIGNTSDWA